MKLNQFLKVITANNLRSGLVTYMTDNYEWVSNLGDAAVITDADLAKAGLAFAESQSDVVVGAYLSDVKQDELGLTAIHFRDKFRSQGPSNVTNGKQGI